MSAMELTCVVCPNGCTIFVELDEAGTRAVSRVWGNTCERGARWAHQEAEHPMRTIASSVPVDGGDLLLASVRTNRPIPVAKIMQVMDEIKRISLKAPVKLGDLVIASPAGCDTEVVATREVGRRRASG